MKFLLDTNACVTFLRKRNSLLTQRLRAQQHSDVVLSSIVISELHYGAERSRDPIKESAVVDGFAQAFACLPFDVAEARLYARLRRDLEIRGLRIGDHDMQIAATALVHNLTLVTHNTAEFSRIPHLKIEDWEAP